MNERLISYIEEKIIPEYSNFDHGHDTRHVRAVINRSIDIAKELNIPNINLDMVYTIAAYHDIGMTKARKGHAKHSYDYVLKDKNLKEFFSQDEILTIAEACEDHSTSTGRHPRTIYGEIVSDADKDTDISIGLMRGWEYSIYHNPDFTFEEHIDNIHNEIKKRFGENGTVKLYLPAEKNKKFMEQMRAFAFDKKLLKKTMQELLDNLSHEEEKK